MGLLQRLAVRAVGNHVIDDGSRELAAEYAAMLARAGVATRIAEMEDEDGMAFIAVDDIYGETLAAIQGSPGRQGYMVAAAPYRSGDVPYLFARPGEGSFADRDILRETLDILSVSGLYAGPVPD